jgi:hypothetical protein
MTYSERQGRRTSAMRQLVTTLLVGAVFIVLGLLLLAGLILHTLPRIDGLVPFVIGGGIEFTGLLRYRDKMRGFGVRRK